MVVKGLGNLALGYVVGATRSYRRSSEPAPKRDRSIFQPRLIFACMLRTA